MNKSFKIKTPSFGISLRGNFLIIGFLFSTLTSVTHAGKLLAREIETRNCSWSLKIIEKQGYTPPDYKAARTVMSGSVTGEGKGPNDARRNASATADACFAKATKNSTQKAECGSRVTGWNSSISSLLPVKGQKYGVRLEIYGNPRLGWGCNSKTISRDLIK